MSATGRIDHAKYLNSVWVGGHVGLVSMTRERYTLRRRP
jgi:hypothetical protein